ncbi:hypothetical protein CCP3SC1AL1_550002 [Gammaproteobacteria bacterium]
MQNQEQASSTALLAMEVSLYFVQNIDDLLARFRPGEASDSILPKESGSFPCQTGGDYEATQVGTTVTLLYHDCKEQRSEDSSESKTTFSSKKVKNGSITFTRAHLKEYEKAYQIRFEMHTEYEDSDKDHFSQSAVMEGIYGNQGKIATTFTNLHLEIMDQGRWYGEDYQYKLLTQDFTVTRNEKGALQYQGNLVTQGKDYETRPLLEGEISLLPSSTPFVINSQGEFTDGSIRMIGDRKTEIFLTFQDGEIWTSLGGD